MSEQIPFDPFPLLSDPHSQTILSAFFNFLLNPSSERKLVRLVDGDQIAVEVSVPRGWKETDPTVFLVHGLCGSYKSPNLIRMARRFLPKGARVARINLRGCGSGHGLAKHMYHGGRSDDLFAALKAFKQETPDSPFVIAGFSLGANLVLKLVGELGDLASQFLKGAIAVSPPVDLYSSVVMLGHPQNEKYERYFMKMIRQDAYFRHKKFRELPRLNLPKQMKVVEFDQLYTAPQYGFQDAFDYYAKCSSIHYIPEITLSTKILLAEDDPIVSAASLDLTALPKAVTLFKTKKGGHLGYLGNPTSDRGLFWLDDLVEEWAWEFFKPPGAFL
jgi:predicted alpha/beta-fold hydrolase